MNRLRIALSIALALALTGLVFGCSKSEPVSPAGQTDGETAEPPMGDEMTIFSWWAQGGEKAGLDELIRLFNEKYPNVKVVNAAVGGGAGVNAKAVLKTRMLGGDPPETFQVHGGYELLDTWVKPGLMEPITDLWKSDGWMDKFPKGLIEMVSDGGEIYAVPSNVHRGNVLWYNTAILEKNKVVPPTDFESFFVACEKLAAAGVTPLSLGSRNKWPVTNLFESILLAEAGPEKYKALFEGTVGWTDESVVKSLEYLGAMMQYVNKDHSALTWDQATGKVYSGEAAMNVMGDWAKGYFTENGWTANKEFGAVAAFDPLGRFDVVTDTFGLPRKSKNPAAARAFLAIVGSEEGQLAFNPKKGSIPARLGVPRDAFDAVSRWSMDDFATKDLVPSLAHGSAAPELFTSTVNNELTLFINDKDPAKTAKALEAAAVDSGLK